MRKLPNFLFAACFLFFISPAFAQLKDLTINAQNISFDQEKKYYEARGSVEVAYRDTKITAEHLIYYTEKDRVSADQGFSLYYDNLNIQGRTIDFGIKTKEGKATGFDFFYRGVKLSGAEIEISPEQFRLRHASFTTCDLSFSHYHVSALDIILYPQYGWLVAYWGFFWLQNIPLVPVPTYIYDVLAEEKGRRNLPPFPEVGSDDDYGTFITERMAWHLRREFSGTYSLSYLSRKGIGGGAEANYIINADNQGNLRFNGNAADGLYGGVTHNYNFGQELSALERPFAFMMLPKYRSYELEATLSSRERINYQKISFLPNLTLKLRRGELFRKDFRTEAEILLGQVAEEGNTQLSRGGGRAKLFYDFPELAVGKFSPMVGLDASFYGNGGRWVKLDGGLELRKQFTTDLTLGLGYRHYFLVSGLSPFNFERYRFFPVDRFTSKLSFLVGETGASLATSHYLPSWQAEDLDYSLFFRLHCYNLVASYRSLRREFSLGVSLVAR